MKLLYFLLTLGLWIILSWACAEENNSETDNAPQKVQKEMLQEETPTAPTVIPPNKLPSRIRIPQEIDEVKDKGGWDEKSIYEKDEGC